MLVRPTKLEIPPEDPFKNDALGRKHIEPPLTQFVTQASGSFVLALDASWGSGKTTFLKMWQVKLQQEGHACLYLNAWQNDFVPDPLIAIIGELTSAINKFADLPDQEGETKKAIKENMEKARKIGMAIGKRLIFGGIKLATYGVIDLDSNMEKTIVETSTDILEDQTKDNKKSKIEDLISEYEDCKSEIENFKEILAKIARQVESLKPSAKVVIIIDELDRCRPTYAIELLERIKHLFDASGVVFILGIDRSQLNHSIRSLYGSEFDATGYLRRFIDYDYQLPEPQSGYYCDYLFKYFGIDELMLKRNSTRNPDEIEQLKFNLGGLMSAARMSLREQEQTISKLRIVLQTIPRDRRIYAGILSLLLFLREWKKNIYADIKEGKIELDNILSQIEALPNIKAVSDDSIDMGIIEAYFLIILEELKMGRFIEPRIEHYKKLAKSDGLNTNNEVRKAQQIIRTYDGVVNNPYDNISISAIVGFKTTLERIALTNSFVHYED